MKFFLFLYIPSATLMAWLGVSIFPTAPWWGSIIWGMITGVFVAFFGAAILGFLLMGSRLVVDAFRD